MKPRVVGLRAFVGGAGLIAGQVAYVSRRRLPLGAEYDPSGTFGEATRPRLRLAVLGDSSVTGQGLASVDESWPRIVARHLADRYHVELLSYAAGGARSEHVLSEQVPAAETRRHDVVIVSVGSNDILRMTPAWRFERRLDEIVARLQRVAASVILFGVGDLGSIPRFPYPVDRMAAGSARVADWVHRRVAERRGVAKIDQWNLTTEAFNSGPHMFAPDLFHPSAAGHRAWADAVLPTVETELLRAKRELRYFG